VSRRSFEDHAGRIEDIGSRRVVREFLAPLMSRLALHPGESVVLSDGCGRGADVEELRGLGFESWGVDPGLRSEEWSRRVCTEYLLHGDGTDLPFASAIFDFVFSEGVIEHVGLSGDHNLPAEISKHDKLERDRIAYCDEIYRVLKPGGYALIGGPNRLFPIDFFHGGRPFLGLCFRFHSFRERFLASASDVRTWFGESVTVKSISLDGFFNMSLL
jgi:SAM-dependent methyltransferase